MSFTTGFQATASPATASTNATNNYQVTAAQCKKRLSRFIRTEKEGLKVFFGTVDTEVNSALDRLRAPERAAAMVDGLLKDGCPKEMALRFTALTMYDLVVLLGVSSSVIGESVTD
jgi:hypothetical protein